MAVWFSVFYGDLLNFDLTESMLCDSRIELGIQIMVI